MLETLAQASEWNGFGSAAAFQGSTTLPFVIPSAAEGPAVQRTFPGNVFFAHSAPEAAIEGAVLDGFRNMTYGDARLGIEVRNRAGDF
jgi:hypothetical protein